MVLAYHKFVKPHHRIRIKLLYVFIREIIMQNRGIKKIHADLKLRSDNLSHNYVYV